MTSRVALLVSIALTACAACSADQGPTEPEEIESTEPGALGTSPVPTYVTGGASPAAELGGILGFDDNDCPMIGSTRVIFSDALDVSAALTDEGWQLVTGGTDVVASAGDEVSFGGGLYTIEDLDSPGTDFAQCEPDLGEEWGFIASLE